MSAHRAVFPIAAMCRVLDVSSSGYYAWAKRAPPARAASDAALIKRIGAVHAASHGTYGGPRTLTRKCPARAAYWTRTAPRPPHIYEVAGEYVVGVHGAGWNFYDGVWDRLYDVCGIRWHEYAQA